MKFFKTISDSVYNPSFYSNLKDVRVGQSISFYFKLIVLISVISVIPFIPVINSALSSGVFKALADKYPSNLEVKITNGKVSTNVTEPYTLTYFENNKTIQALVIDTKTPFSSSQFNEYKTSILLKKDSIAVLDNSGSIKVYPLDKVTSLTVNEENVRTWFDALHGILKALMPIIFILLYIGFIIAYAFKLVYLFIAALLVMLIIYIAKRPRSYIKSYQIGLHALIPVILLQAILGFFKVGLPYLIPSLLLLIVVLVNIIRIPNVPNELASEPVRE